MGITSWERVPALGLEASFIDDLADAVVEVLPRIEEPPKSDMYVRTPARGMCCLACFPHLTFNTTLLL